MNKLISYLMDFVSYLMLQPDINNIDLRRIILFGSAARGDSIKQSDVDIFIDIASPTEKKKDFIRKTLENFRISDRIKKWRLIGITNEIQIIADNLNQDKWEELKNTMEIEGRVLWDRFSPSELELHYLVKWDTKNIDPKKRVNISRFMYGYSSQNKRYPGFVQNANVVKVANSVIIVNPNQMAQLKKFFDEQKIINHIKRIYVKT